MTKEIALGLCVLALDRVGLWAIFLKAGQSGWKSLVPIYNLVIGSRIVGWPDWYAIMGIVPILNILFVISIRYKIARTFGKGQVYSIAAGIWSFIIFPVLGFGSSQYQGPLIVNQSLSPTDSAAN